ncbi:MAG: sensor histidine kinase [Candidatus Spyradocola sp.]
MIRKLRRKFVFINMATVGVVLLVGLTMLLGYTASRQHAAAEAALDAALTFSAVQDIPRRFDPPGADGMPPMRDRQGKEDFFSSFCVQLDAQGNVVDTSLLNLSIAQEDIATAVDAALDSGRTEGTLTRLRLRFRMEETADGLRIAFVDRAQDWSTLRTLGLSCLVGYALAMAALLCVSLYLSRWALRPVQAAWDQQRQFIADASHELKTPLTVILANTGILLSNPDQTVDAQRRWVENTRDEGLRMKKLVDDLLFLARADAGRMQAVRTAINLSDAVWSAVLPFESVAFEKGIALDADVQPDLTAPADEAQLRQAVSILMDNACKYAPAGGSVCVMLRRAQNRPLLTVRNTGSVIPPEALPHLFERFYRADASRAHDAGGYGLGLSILDTIARTNGWKLSVESTEASGTTFSILFPA